MNDDLGKKIDQIAELLGQNNVPDNVKELIGMLATSMASKKDSVDKNVPIAEADTGTTDEPPPSDFTPEDEKAERPGGGDSSNSDLLNLARNALTRLNTNNDPRINLLHAIKPFMNSRRQKKISNCIQLLQVASLSKLLNERDNTPK